VNYTVEYGKAAARRLERLDRQVQERVRDAIAVLAGDPRPVGVQKLSGPEDLYRIRAGDWRIVYQIRDRILRILVVRIGHRRDVYR
jgi:mRNA interferase RelE/StbE